MNDAREKEDRYTQHKRLPTKYQAILHGIPQRRQPHFQLLIDAISGLCEKFIQNLDLQTARINSLENRLNNDAVVARLDKLIQLNLQFNTNLKHSLQNKLIECKDVKIINRDNPEKGSDTKLLIQQVSRPETVPVVKRISIRPIQQVNKSEEYLNIATHPDIIPIYAALESEPDVLTQDIASIVVFLTQTPLEHLVKRLKTKMGDTYSKMAEKLYFQYSTSKISYRDMRIQFAEGVIDLHYQIQQDMAHQTHFNQLQKVEIAQELDKSGRNVLEFLMSKYPPSRNKVVDIEISNRIREIRRHTDPVYEMLNNASMRFFRSAYSQDFTFEVKRWVNRLIIETKVQFPLFKETVKSIFVGGQNTSEILHNSLEYEINSKINLTTSLYTDEELLQRRLDLKSPQLLRILTKWTNELYSVLLHPQEWIIGRKFGFKSVAKGMTVGLSRKRKEKLINKLKTICETQVHSQKLVWEKYIHRLINDVFVLARAGFKDYDQLNPREVSNIKISQYLRECTQTYCMKMLNKLVNALNSVRSTYKEGTLQSNIDLVTFNVLDLLRCRCVTTKRELFRIYKEVIQKTDYFEVVRVKNKLHESTRDILINLKIKNSFMMCEMQLAIGDDRDEINDHFCHNMYELHRSAFPILFETANLLVNLDYRMNYFTAKHPVQFYVSAEMLKAKEKITCIDNSLYCSMSHYKVQMIYQANGIPFCCSHCSTFTNAFSSCLEYVRCSECMVTICPKCIVETYPSIMMHYLNRYIDCKEIRPFIKPVPIYSGFCTNQNLEVQIQKTLTETQYIHVLQFDSRGSKVRSMKKYKNNLTPAFYTFTEIAQAKVSDSPLNWNLLIQPFQTQVYDLDTLLYYQKSTIGSVSWPELEDILDRRKIRKVIATVDEATKKALIVDIVESPEEIHSKRAHDHNMERVATESSKPSGVVELTGRDLKNLSILSYVKNPLALKNINLWENSLVEVKKLKQFPKLRQLNLRENDIASFEGITELTELQSLNLHQNALKGIVPQLNMRNLKFMDLSCNQINSLVNLSTSNLTSLNVLIISFNDLRHLPILNLPQLEIFSFINNNVEDLVNLAVSKFPKLRRLLGHNNRVCEALPQLNLPTLEHLLLQDNQLSDIQMLQTSNLESLEIANLSNNNITRPLPILNLSNLTKLYLQNNSLTSLEEISLWNLPSIATIDLTNNLVEGELPLIMLPSLKELRLDGNRLTSIQSLELSDVAKLEELSVRCNHLRTLPILKHNQLRKLFLDDNQLISCLIMEKWRLPQIDIISMANNGMVSEMPILFMPRLRELNIDNNNITDLSCLREKQLLPKLEFLSAANNPLLQSQVCSVPFWESQGYTPTTRPIQSDATFHI